MRGPKPVEVQLFLYGNHRAIVEAEIAGRKQAERWAALEIEQERELAKIERERADEASADAVAASRRCRMLNQHALDLRRIIIDAGLDLPAYPELP